MRQYNSSLLSETYHNSLSHLERLIVNNDYFIKVIFCTKNDLPIRKYFNYTFALNEIIINFTYD